LLLFATHIALFLSSLNRTRTIATIEIQILKREKEREKKRITFASIFFLLLFFLVDFQYHQNTNGSLGYSLQKKKKVHMLIV